MPFANMVKAFQSNRSNHALGIGVLPGRAWRNDRFPDVQRLGLTRKSFSIDLVSVTDQMAWGLLQPARLDQLPSSPIRGRMFRDIEMHQPAPVVAGPCTSRPSPAIPSGPASAARRGSSAHPREDWRG